MSSDGAERGGRAVSSDGAERGGRTLTGAERRWRKAAEIGGPEQRDGGSGA